MASVYVNHGKTEAELNYSFTADDGFDMVSCIPFFVNRKIRVNTAEVYVGAQSEAQAGYRICIWNTGTGAELCGKSVSGVGPAWRGGQMQLVCDRIPLLLGVGRPAATALRFYCIKQQTGNTSYVTQTVYTPQSAFSTAMTPLEKDGTPVGIIGRLDYDILCDSVSGEDCVLTAGTSAQVALTVTPDDAREQDIGELTSSNESIVRAELTGERVITLTGISGGSAVIGFTTADGAATGSFNVTVNAVPVTDVTLSEETLELLTGESKKLTATVEPENATDKTVIFSSSAPEIAAVDENGCVTALAEGSAVIGAAASSCAASCALTVSPRGISKHHGIYVKQNGSFVQAKLWRKRAGEWSDALNLYVKRLGGWRLAQKFTQSISIENIIPNGLFLTGDLSSWSQLHVNSSVYGGDSGAEGCVKVVSYCVSYASATTDWLIYRSMAGRVIPGHVYYLKTRCRFASSRARVWGINGQQLAYTDIGSWTTVTQYAVCTSADFMLGFGSYFPVNCETAGITAVDLTAAFGAGNEPDRAWCDANIPWFEGTTNLEIALED